MSTNGDDPSASARSSDASTRPLYKSWFRVEWEGLEKIPESGGALLICNHAAAIPSDAPVIMHGIEEEFGRPVYGMADFFFRTVPWVGTIWSRTGGVTAHPDNALRLLRDQGQLALVFPEGTKGPSKTYQRPVPAQAVRTRRLRRDRHEGGRPRRADRLHRSRGVDADRLQAAYLGEGSRRSRTCPSRPTCSCLARSGSLGYFPSKFKLRVLDPVRFDMPSGQERYSKSRIMDEAESIRTHMQETIYDMLRDRRSVWFG